MIETVLGPISAEELGRTSMHDHLLADATLLHRPVSERPPAGERVTMENLGFIRRNLLALADNLILADAELAAVELSHARAHGQRAVVELTSHGLGPQPRGLAEIARASGMHVVAGCGVYLDRPHPAWVGALSDQALGDYFIAALTVELEDAGCRAGILGVIGTGEPITRSERRVLAACAGAAGVTGAPVAIRLDWSGRRGLEVLELMRAGGCPPSQVIFSNVDEFIDLPYLGELAAAGATLEWCFGSEAYLRDGIREPTDAERLGALIDLLAGDGELAGRCVLGGSVWTKSQLRAYGGWGYEHLFAHIVPELERRGVGPEAITTMCVDNPAQLLDR